MRLRTLLLLTPFVAACGAEEDQSKPTLRIQSPADGGVGPADGAVRLSATIKDKVDDPSQLALIVESDLDGELCRRVAGTDGEVRCSAVLSEGEHVLTYMAIDEAGNRATGSRTWTAAAAAEQDVDGDGVLASEGDCDDADPAVFPGADEVENGVDDDCDGVTDEGTAASDDDGDGFTEAEGDCDDADAAVGPDAVEVLDGVDNNCDGLIDEGTDEDNDLDGYTEVEGDCDDTDGTVSPGATEGVNGVDDDCNGIIDDGTAAYDDDGDGFAEVDGDCDDAEPLSAPGLAEATDGIDNDCDGDVDEPDGTWTGTLELSLVGDVEATCAADLVIGVDRTTTPALVGEGACDGATLTTLTLTAELVDDTAWVAELGIETTGGAVALTELVLVRDGDALSGSASGDVTFDDGAIATLDATCAAAR